MALLPFGWHVLAVVVLILTFSSIAVSGDSDKLGQESNLKRFADISISEDEALRLIKDIRKYPPKKEEAATWIHVANSDKYSNVRRRRAILQFFDRNVSQGMTLGELVSLLAKPSWLERENVIKITGPMSGHVPVPPVEGETVFCLSIGLPPTDASSVYVRIKGFSAATPVTKDTLYDTLQGKETNVTGLTITRTIAYPGEYGELAYVKHDFEYASQSDAPKTHWSRHWEIVFLTDNMDVYAKQLDFFDIELGVIEPDNKINYANHFSKPKPDSRILENPAAKERRYYLTWGNRESRQADRELMKQAGIDADQRLILKFISKAVETQLCALERNHGGVPLREIAKTRFGVRANGKEFSFYVLEQVLKEKQTQERKPRKSGVSENAPKTPATSGNELNRSL